MNTHTHRDTQIHTQSDVRQSLSQPRESWTLTRVLSPWKAEGRCLFGLAVVNVHTSTCTHKHDWKVTQTTGRGWLALFYFPCSMLILGSVSYFSAGQPSSGLRVWCTLTHLRHTLMHARTHIYVCVLYMSMYMKQPSPLTQSVSKTASKMNSTIFRMSILCKHKCIFSKSERHMDSLDTDTRKDQSTESNMSINNLIFKLIRKNIFSVMLFAHLGIT